MSSVAVTGHRVLGKNFDAAKLERTLRALIAEGSDTFYCGMALGFDSLCCEMLQRLRGEFSVRVIACVPCADQASRYGEREKRRYDRLLAACDDIVVLHSRYENGCMFERNRWMVDRCDVLVAYLEAPRGGTFYTVNYAKKREKRIVFL